MEEITENQILKKVKKARIGTLFFADSFAGIASSKTINKGLERLVKAGKLNRVATGIYVRPRKDKILGTVMPSIDEIARAIAKRDKARISPTGVYALYKIGLTTQVPLNVVYHTSGSSRKVSVGKRTIKFKKAAARNLVAEGQISKLVIQALRTIGKDKVTDVQLKKIRELLKGEDVNKLKKDIDGAPHWIGELLEIGKSR